MRRKHTKRKQNPKAEYLASGNAFLFRGVCVQECMFKPTQGRAVIPFCKLKPLFKNHLQKTFTGWSPQGRRFLGSGLERRGVCL